jgi:hypothetical protein
MRKIATMFLLILSIGLMFGGAVSAQDPAEVDVTVVHEDGTEVTDACPGDKVGVDVVASANDETVVEPGVVISVDPETGLEFVPEEAMMQVNGGPIIPNDMTDYPKNAFFYWSDDFQGWVWYIGAVTGDMQPGDVAELIAPAVVTDTGPITVTADFYTWPENDPEPTLLDSDSYTFLSEPCEHNVCAKTVPMQETGTPVALAALGLLSIIGGALYSRLQ